MLLNCTSRKQVEGVLPEFTKRWPTPEEFSRADRDEVRSLIAPLGFKDRRTDNLIRMTEDFLSGSWEHARQLHGVGDYAARCWEIFCLGEIGDEPPKDHALTRYWAWCRLNDAFPPDYLPGEQFIADGSNTVHGHRNRDDACLYPMDMNDMSRRVTAGSIGIVLCFEGRYGPTPSVESSDPMFRSDFYERYVVMVEGRVGKMYVTQMSKVTKCAGDETE
jgi:hypothetical protein